MPRAKYPFVDVHGHQSLQLATDQLDRLVGEMDAMNMRVMVNLSGSTGEELSRGLANLKGRYPKRFALGSKIFRPAQTKTFQPIF